MRRVTELRALSLKKTALRRLAGYRIERYQQKYQMLRIIQYFGGRRQNLLLAFSQMFLQLSSTHSCSDRGEAKICSTALAKYVLEKWKNLRPMIRIANALRQQAQRLYIYSLFRKGFDALKEGSTVICHKRSLKLSVRIL
jgi:hypothetical protein